MRFLTDVVVSCLHACNTNFSHSEIPKGGLVTFRLSPKATAPIMKSQKVVLLRFGWLRKRSVEQRRDIGVETEMFAPTVACRSRDKWKHSGLGIACRKILFGKYCKYSMPIMPWSRLRCSRFTVSGKKADEASKDNGCVLGVALFVLHFNKKWRKSY